MAFLWEMLAIGKQNIVTLDRRSASFEKKSKLEVKNWTVKWVAAAAKSPQSCPTLCDPIDGSPPGSPVPEILQARTLEWVAISFSSARKWKVKVKSLSRVRLFVTPWTAAYQAPPPIGFSSEEEALINFLGSQKILSLEIRSLESICKTAHKWLFI